jgi:hypothetical protein
MKFAIIAAVLVGVAMAVSPPVFDGDWTSFQSNELDISQGEYTVKNNEVCCSTTAAACKVQTVDEQGTFWQSFSKQATKQSINGGYIITLISENPQYEYAVEANANGTLVCQNKCPNEGQDVVEPLVKDWFIPQNGNGTTVTYRGEAVYPDSATACGPKGAKCQVWEVKDTILGIVVMETAEQYINVQGSNPVPVASITTLTPFGEHIGTEKTMYEQYKGYPTGLPASTFEFTNKDKCPPPNGGCNQNNGGGGGGNGAYKNARNAARNWQNHVTEKVKGRFAFDVEAMFA